MAGVSLLMNNFMSGEVSPLTAAQVNSERWSSGCIKLENFIPMMTGGVRKRPGTKYYKTTTAEPRKLIEFDKELTIEVTANRLRFLDRGLNSRPITSQIITSDVTQPVITIDQLLLLYNQTIQYRNFFNSISANIDVDVRNVTSIMSYVKVIIDVNDARPVQTETAVVNGVTYWLFRNKEDNPEELYTNIDMAQDIYEQCRVALGLYSGLSDIKVMAELADTTGKLIMEAVYAGYYNISLNVYNAIRDNMLKLYDYMNTNPAFELQGYDIHWGSGIPSNIVYRMRNLLHTTRTNSNVVRLYGIIGLKTILRYRLDYETDIFPMSTRVLDNVSMAFNLNVSYAQYIMNPLPDVSGTDIFNWYDENSTNVNTEIITQYNTATNMANLVYAKTNDLVILCSSEGLLAIEKFSNGEFYIRKPKIKILKEDIKIDFRFACFYSGRLFLAGNSDNKIRIYGSRSYDAANNNFRYFDFQTQDDDGNVFPDHAIILEEQDMYGSEIKWITAGHNFISGTTRAVWTDTGGLVTPASFDMNIAEYAGSEAIAPVGTKEVIAYVAKGFKALHGLIYQATQSGSGYVDTDISLAAEHLFSDGIKALEVSTYPQQIIWALMNSGKCAACLIDMRMGVIAFWTFAPSGNIKDMVVLHEGEDEQVLFTVERDGVYTYEQIEINDLVNESKDKYRYCDGSVDYETPPPGQDEVRGTTDTVTGLQHLAGRDVVGWADESKILRGTVNAAGTVTFPQRFTKITVGLPVKSVISPNQPELPANGTSLGKKRRIEAAMLKVFNSYGGKIGTEETKLFDIPYLQYGVTKFGGDVEMKTGDIDITTAGVASTEGRLYIEHSEPAPFTLLALVERAAVLEV